jgi:hypothetical protein
MYQVLSNAGILFFPEYIDKLVRKSFLPSSRTGNGEFSHFSHKEQEKVPLKLFYKMAAKGLYSYGGQIFKKCSTVLLQTNLSEGKTFCIQNSKGQDNSSQYNDWLGAGQSDDQGSIPSRD